MSEFSHLRDDGSAHMVDVGAKPATDRRATAQAVVRTTPEVVDAVMSGTVPKGETVGTARIAGIMAAKRTWELIPLCHPLPLSSVEIDITPRDAELIVVATAATTAPTGVEMEALTAATVAALTVYDMIKAVDREASVTDVQVLAKSGGRSGDWKRA